jgi:glyoxylase-like metal-dependent hydrolase (beta-lactamase superfamily II)
VALLPSVAPWSVGAQQAPESVAELTRLADDVYEFRMTGYNTMFIVTDEGVIAMDPIGPSRAPLYKAAIAAVTDQPVRYVIYAHDHADHNGGGIVFADTAEFVSHSLAVPRVAARGDPATPVPTLVFDDHMTLTLGGKAIELWYVGPSHSDNDTLIVYPARRIAFSADYAEHHSLLPTAFSPWLDHWIESLDWVEQNLDFDVLVAGHGPLGSKDTFREMRDFFTDLMVAIRAAQAAGLTDDSPEMLAEVRAELAPRYGGWLNFDSRLRGNVAGVLRAWSQ